MISSFIQCCVHCCGLHMSHVSFSYQRLTLSGRIVSSLSSLLEEIVDPCSSWSSSSSFAFQSSFNCCQQRILMSWWVSHYVARIRQLSVFQVVKHSYFLYTNFLQYINVCGMRSPTNSQHSSVAPPFKALILWYILLNISKLRISMILLKTHITSNVWFWFSYRRCSFCFCPLLHPSMCEDYSGFDTDVALSVSARYCIPQCVRIFLVLILMWRFLFLPVTASLNVWGLFWFSYGCCSFCFCPLLHPSMCEDYSGFDTDVALSVSARYCILNVWGLFWFSYRCGSFCFCPLLHPSMCEAYSGFHTDVALSVFARYCIPQCVRIILVFIRMLLFLFLPVTASLNVWGLFWFSYWCGSFCFCPLLHPSMCEDYSGFHTDVALSVSARYCIPQCVRIILVLIQMWLFLFLPVTVSLNVWGLFWFSYRCCSSCFCSLLHPSMCEDYSGSHTDVALSVSARYCIPQCVRIILVFIRMLLFLFLPVTASLNVWGLFWFSYWCGSFCICPLLHPSMCEDYSGSHTDVALSVSSRYRIPQCVRIILVFIRMLLFLFLLVTASLNVWGLLQMYARGRLVKRRIYSTVDKSNIKDKRKVKPKD